MPYDEAVAGGAMALFGEKYTANVRVVGICSPETTEPRRTRRARRHEDGTLAFRKELCGGTHCSRTGEIGAFVIASESSVGSGLRRIEALTGRAGRCVRAGAAGDDGAARRKLNATPARSKRASMRCRRSWRRSGGGYSSSSAQAGRAEADALLASAEKVGDASLLVSRVPAANVEALREMGDVLREKLGSAVIVLGAVIGDKPNFLVISTKELNARVHAGSLVKQIAAIAGGGGGGRPDMAQAGGKDASKLDAALDLARQLARAGLGS